MSEREKAAIKAAQEAYMKDIDIEIEDNARTSEGNDGFWVQAWVFVSHDEVEEMADGD